MPRTDTETALFNRWRAKRPELIPDGMVDAAAYEDSNPRLLYLLKDVNDPGHEVKDLCDLLRKGGRRQTWSAVARWTRGIRALPEHTVWADVENVDHDMRVRELLTIAAMNLKKAPGGGSTDGSALAAAAREDAALLTEQFKIYEPDVAICCGSDVAHLVNHVLGLGSPGWQRTSRGVEYKEYSKGKFIISWMHPQAHVSANLAFYGLIDAVRELR